MTQTPDFWEVTASCSQEIAEWLDPSGVLRKTGPSGVLRKTGLLKEKVDLCPDCGVRGEKKGHMTCQYPQD